MRAPLKQPGLAIALIIGTATVLLLPVVVVTGFMALQDFGEWNYQGYVLGRALNGEALGVATLKDYPVPYAVSNVVLGVLSAVLPPAAAGVATIGVQVVAGAVAVVAVTRRRSLDWRVAVPILAVLVIFGSGLWNGYSAHQFGLAAFTASLAVPRRHGTRPGVILLFSLLTFFSHALVFFAYAVSLGVLAIVDRRIVPATVGMLPSVALTLWYAANSPPEPAGGGVSLSSPVAWVAYKGYTFAKSGGYQNLIVNGTGDAKALMLGGAVINAVTVGLILVLAAWSLIRLRPTTWRQSPDLIAGTALLVLGLALPAFFLGIVNPGERIIAPGLILVTIAALETGSLPTTRVLAASAACAGIVLTGVSSATLAAKAERGDPAPQDPTPTFDESSGARTDTLFGHRLDQMESRFDLAEQAWRDGAPPTVDLIFNEGLLLPSD